MLTTKLRRTTGSESGLTLIELLVVLIVMAVLLTIAVASYLGYQERAADRAAQANLRGAMPAAEVYFENNESYELMTAADLLALDSGVSSSLEVASSGPNSYCLTDTVSGRTWSMLGPGASLGFRPSADCS